MPGHVCGVVSADDEALTAGVGVATSATAMDREGEGPGWSTGASVAPLCTRRTPTRPATAMAATQTAAIVSPRLEFLPDVAGAD